RSAGPGKPTVAEYADVVCRFLDALNIDRAVIVGSSMGGAIAQFLGINHADRVQGLGLVGTGARLRVLPAFLTGIVDDTLRTVALINEALFTTGADPGIKALSERGMLDCGPQVLHEDYAACDIFDVREHISKIRAPTLVLCGDQDKMTPVKYSQYLAERIPGATLEIITGAGHLVMLEKPDEVNRSLVRFLDQIAAAA
ncbi:MAG: alpha/beta fold hydrolase, partial [Rudaea sp.]